MSYPVSIAEEFLTELDDLHARFRRWAKSLSSDEYRELATYLYWMKPEISVPQIAEMIGFTPAAKVNEIVDKRYPLPVLCEFCGQTKHVHYSSRKRKASNEWDRERLALLKSPDWQSLRAAYIKGTFKQEYKHETQWELDTLVRYSWAAPHDGVCDECREYLKAEFEELERLRDEQIQQYKKMPYQDYLYTDHWKEFRLTVLFNADYRCQLCNRGGRTSGITLNVHHRTYDNLGNESVRDVVVLCQPCHHNFHATGKVAR